MDTERLYFIDRLRFLAVMVLVLFHTALIFAAQSNFPIKNVELSGLLEELVFFFHSWRLGLLFFISGVGTSLALSRRTRIAYVKERLHRLLIPLLFGILVIVPPQIYMERISQGFEFESFSNFYTNSFSTGLYPYGNISWNHLWFVAYLLIYSIASLPLLTLFAKRKTLRFDEMIRNGGILFWSFPLAVIVVLLKPHSLGVQNIVDDLAMFFFYWLVFLAGFTVNQKKYWSFFEHKNILLTFYATLMTVLAYTMKWYFPRMEKGDLIFLTFNFIKGVNAWLWILVLVSLGKQFLNTPGKYLPVLNEAVYPIYILHQTIIICLGYFVVQQDWPIGVKFLTISLATIFLCWFLYLVLRTNKLTRVLFGMKSNFTRPKTVSTD